ncbi:MAG: heme-binding protein [Bacteroidales bacterium]|nr:heme-binding protein [Bacteroidales bacterium]
MPRTDSVQRTGQGTGSGTTRTTHLVGERLEDRLAPSVTTNVMADSLVILGDNGDQRILVDQDPLTSQIIVRSAGVEVGRFDPAGISQIGITTGAGNDRIEVSPQVLIPVLIDSGAGKDVLKAGSGTTTAVGGADTNKFLGGSGTNNIIGGDQTDRIVAGAGFTTVDGRAGINHILQVKAQDNIIPNVGDVVSNAPDVMASLNAQLAALSKPQQFLAADEVQMFLDRASAATTSNDAIIVVVDRNGRILGVRAEAGVAPEILNNNFNLVFAVDGAVAKARTAALFANANAPLTSRTIRFISQSTITEREVNSNPNITDPNSTERGPGFVAPIGPGGHFPPGIANTPQVDLFAIEHTNRDGTFHPGPDRIKGTADDVQLPQRFNINPAFVPAGQSLSPMDSYGFVSGLLPGAQSRGIATVPGGVPIFKNGQVVGGIGVFFPGKTGYASEENPGDQGALNDPSKPDRSLEAEYMAFAAVGGSAGSGFAFPGAIGNAPALPAAFNTVPFARIDLVGITLDVFGPGGSQGPSRLFQIGQAIGIGSVSGKLLPVGNDASGAPVFFNAGQPVPEGWLVVPHDGVGVTAAEATTMVLNGITQANQTRAAIRQIGSVAKFVIAVSDLEGNVIALYRMPDATVFSIDVAVTKSRNAAYYANPLELQPIDQVPGIPAGTAFSARTFRYLAEPRFPEGIDGLPPGPFSIFVDGNVDPRTARNLGAPLPASAYQSVLGYDAFNPQTNFRDPANILNQSGVIFFPGSAPIYRRGFGGTGLLMGGLGVSGDGVDQDDVVTHFAANGYYVPATGLQADQTFVNGVRLPYSKFNRNPEGGIPHQNG